VVIDTTSLDSINIRGNILNRNNIYTGSLWKFGIEKKEIMKFEIKNDFFSFSLPSSIEPGVYRLQLSDSIEKHYIDLIVDGIEKNIIFDIVLNVNTIASLEFKESIQNLNWYSYIKSTSKSINRLDKLHDYLSIFHDKKVDRYVIKTFINERDKYYNLFNKFVNDNKNNWSGLMVRNRPYYFSNLRKKPVLRDFIRKNYFWDDIDTNNPSLINSPLYGDLINIYLDKYYIHPQETYNKTQKDYNIKKAIDILLQKFSTNLVTKKFIVDYLLKYFNDLDMNEIINYINKKQS
jgi:hypothetical protein